MTEESKQLLLADIKDTERRAKKIITHEVSEKVAQMDLRAMEKMVRDGKWVEMAVNLHEKMKNALSGLGKLVDDKLSSAAMQNFQDTEYQIRKSITQLMGPV